MSALPTLLAHPSLADLPLHERLVRALRTAILEGHLLLHSRLPASRALAEDLSVSRSTVELAYSRLEAEGYLQRRMGAGTFVALAAQPQPKRAGVAAAGLPCVGSVFWMPDSAVIRLDCWKPLAPDRGIRGFSPGIFGAA